MRVALLLLAAALCPLLGVAQDEFTAGTYELADGTKGAGQLDYQAGNHPKLLIKDATADPSSKAGKKGQAYSPEQLRSFDLGSDHYVTLHSIQLNFNVSNSTKKDDFAKVLETGKLELLHYQVFYVERGHFPVNGVSDDSRHNTMVYLLRWPGEDKATMIPNGKDYKKMLASFLASRPDLVKKLDVPLKSPAEYYLLIRTLVKEYNGG